MFQKAAEELIQSRNYLAIRNEPKKHSSWTVECREVVTQYLFSCMLLTLHIYSRHVVSRTRPSRPSGGSGSRYILTCTGLAPRFICSGLGSAPTATAHAQNVLQSETKTKVRPKILARTVRISVLGTTFSLDISSKPKYACAIVRPHPFER